MHQRLPGTLGRFVLHGCVLSLLGCGDAAQLSNTSGSENGLLVDGQQSAGFQNDRTFTSANDKIGIGQFTAGPGEVVAFTNLRPVAVTTPVTWTTSDETATVPFAARIQIPVTVWIVQGPFAAQRDLAIDHCITTSGIWNSERMGVDFNPFNIVDATADPERTNYLAFDCSERAGIQTDIGRVAGRINIYWVNTVDGGTGRGQACSIGSDFVAMGSATGAELLSHELGHDFALQHIDGQASTDQTNIMHSASNTRQFITEGQLFRAHLRTDSALNSVYAARPGLTTRNCAHGDATNTCPTLLKRIWADGTFPAN